MLGEAVRLGGLSAFEEGGREARPGDGPPAWGTDWTGFAQAVGNEAP